MNSNIILERTISLSDYAYLDIWRDGAGEPWYFVMQKIAEPNIFDRQAIVKGGAIPTVVVSEDGKTVLKIKHDGSGDVIYPPTETERAKDLMETT